jgi:hypothetical protein
MKKSYLLIALLLFISLIVEAKSVVKGVKKEIPQKTYTTKKLVGEAPNIDGKGDDAAWQQVEWSGDFIQREPNEDSLPSQKTAFKILYDLL